MPYWLKFTLYLLAVDVVVFTLAHLLSEYGLVIKLIVAGDAVVMVIALALKRLLAFWDTLLPNYRPNK